MPVWASTLLGVIVGAALAYGASQRIEGQRRAGDAAAARRSALAVFLGRLYILVGTLSQWPEELPPNIVERIRSNTIEKSARVRVADWITTQKKLREVLGDDFYAPLHRFLEAAAVLEFIELHPQVRARINDAVDYIERLAKNRDNETLEAWFALRERLLAALAANGDAPVIEAAALNESFLSAAPEASH
jgi:hypothetical protein